MSGLQDLLASPERLLGRLRVQAPELRALRRSVEALQGEADEGAGAEGTAEVQDRLISAVQAQSLPVLGLRDLREAAKTLFHPPLAPGRDEAALTALCGEVARRRRQAAFLALVGAYIDGFDVQDPDIARLASWLESARVGWPWRPHDPWPSRAERFHLFLPGEAPARIAKAVLQDERPPLTVLADAGLDTDGRRRGGLALAALKSACARVEVATGQKAQAGQLKLVEWAFPDGSGRSMLAPDAWPELAGALFVPWTAAPPEKAHQALITDLAIDYAGDPRTMPPRWRKVHEVRPDALLTLKRWLVRASVLQFFDIVDSVADARMWRYRRAFWKAYVEAEHVDDAWIVFGAAGISHAKSIAERLGEPALRQFGHLEPGGGRGPNHACLLMRIGDLTIAEWSHNGRCYMWRRDTPRHPKLGQLRYHPDQLAHPLNALDGAKRIGVAHLHAETFGWQRRVAELIAEETGARTKQRDWIP